VSRGRRLRRGGLITEGEANPAKVHLEIKGIGDVVKRLFVGKAGRTDERRLTREREGAGGDLRRRGARGGVWDKSRHRKHICRRETKGFRNYWGNKEKT